MNSHWGKLAGYFVGSLVVSSAVTIGLPLLGGGSWMPAAISVEASSIDALFWGLIILSLVIFSIVSAMVMYSIVHFRVAPGDMSDGEHIHGNAKLEAVWIVIPSIICLVIAAVSYDVMRKNEVGLFPAAEKTSADMDVHVRGYSFGWNFRYDGMDSADAATELVLPVDTQTRFIVNSCSGREAEGRVREEVRRQHSGEGHEEENPFADIPPGTCEKDWNLASEADLELAEETELALIDAQEQRADGKRLTPEQQELLDAQPAYGGDQQFIDVNHAFWVPETRLKVDAVSGVPTYVQWEADRETGIEDRFQVVCAELCGTGHNGMRVDMCVVSKTTFAWWVKLRGDDRRDATCVNLRALTCLESFDDPADAIAAIAKVHKDDPEPDCTKIEEAVA